MVRKFYAVDLFCGAGGCSEGLIQAGFHILYSSDISEMVEVTYTNRHRQLGLIQGINTWFERADIKDLRGQDIYDRIAGLEIFRAQEVPEIDLMIGGPSCQGFSRAGRRDRSDPRNMLFGEYVRVISEVRPKYVVLENVEGFMDMPFFGFEGITGIEYPDGSVTPYILRSELKEIGYESLEPKILNAADYGVPQRRNRAIFMAYRVGLQPPRYPEPTVLPEDYLTITDAIGDLIPNDEIRKQVNPKPSQYQIDSIAGRTPRIGGGPIKADTIYNMEQSGQSDIVRERFSLFAPGETASQLKKRIVENGIELRDKPALLEHCSAKMNQTPEAAADIFRTPPVDPAYVDILLTKKRIRQRWDPARPASSVVTISDDFIHPWEPRTFTVREMARFQSFDDSFQFLGKRVTGGLQRRTEIPQYSQAGNAVPPLLAKAVALQIREVLEPPQIWRFFCNIHSAIISAY